MTKTSDFTPSGLIVLRTPLLPAGEIENWSADLLSTRALADGDPELEEALARDRDLLRSRLRDLVARPEVREALFLASPDLTASLEAWQRDPESRKGQRTEHGLVRYFLRMASRPTPFGLFSGCTAGGTGPATRLGVSPRAGYERHSRLDMDYLFALCEHLARSRALRSALTFRPNSSLYETAGRCRYAEARVSGRTRTYHLVAVDAFDALTDTLRRAAEGARLRDLAEALVAAGSGEDPEDAVSLDEAEEFLHELVDNQILTPDLTPAVTGEESTPALLRQLAALGSAPGPHEATEAAEAHQRLARAEHALAMADARGLGRDPAGYEEVARELEPLGVAVEMSRLFQVDMVKPAADEGSVAVGPEVVSEVLRGVELLHSLSQARREGPLEEFASAFRERYGDGREVPLLAALDEESGIGFERSGTAAADASPLLSRLHFVGRGERPTVPWSGREITLLRLLSDALREGRTEIEITEDHLRQMANPDRLPLPNALHALVTLAAASPEALEAGDFRVVLEHAGGPSGAKLLGRFCHADERVRSGVEAHLAAEEAHAPDAVFAEIVHLPAGRIGNILARPVLRGWEIPFLGASGAPPERQISVDDLLVTVIGDRVRLRSQRLGREVVPSLTTAHNTARESLGVYRFLSALRGQGVTSYVMWSWGALEAAPFLPRVTAGRLVLSRARWRVDAEEIRPLAQASGARRWRLAREWQAGLGMPRFLCLVDGDNELLLDFENPLSLDAVVELIKSREQALLTELYPAPGELCAHGPEGRFFHEILIPFVRHAEARPRPAPPRAVSPGAKRIFPPGSEWLYAKIYAGNGTADLVLRDEIGPLAREAVAAGDARRWFFLRYGDPARHLRVRFQGDPARLRESVLPRLEAAFERLVDSGAAWKCQLDTYEREIERYGGDGGIELSEELFFHDSEAVLETLGSLASDAGADLRWRLALLGMDRMLEDFGYGLEARLRLAERGRAGLSGRYRYEALRDRLAERLRRERPVLERLLALRADGPEELRPALEALARRSAALSGIARELRARERQGRLAAPVDELVFSYLHMFVNRMSRSAGPEHELVLYDFLVQLYGSRLARERKAAAAPRKAVG